LKKFINVFFLALLPATCYHYLSRILNNLSFFLSLMLDTLLIHYLGKVSIPLSIVIDLHYRDQRY
jgi:hypothetical protein